MNDYEVYVKAVVDGLMAMFPAGLLEYTGTDYQSMEHMVENPLIPYTDDHYYFTLRPVHHLYENDFPVEDAIKHLYDDINALITTQAKVM